MATATPVPATPQQLVAITYDANGLVPVVCQELTTGEVLMVAWMNAETLRITLETVSYTHLTLPTTPYV